jgi:transposase InsO family protein
MLDLTEIPGFLRLYSFKLAVVLDVFSRAPLAARVFFQEPTGHDMAEILTSAALRFGSPRHSVSDQGVQFRSGTFRNALARLGIRHRFGAIGRTGSIALVERFFRTLKTVAGLHSRPPLLRRDLEHRLALAFLYYLWLRPHQGLAGATPADVLLGPKGSRTVVPPPRGRPGEQSQVSLGFELRHLDREKHLPYLSKAA